MRNPTKIFVFWVMCNCCFGAASWMIDGNPLEGAMVSNGLWFIYLAAISY